MPVLSYIILSLSIYLSQFTIPSSSTLATLKTKINSDPNLGPIPHTQQRLFHLGRELKSSNRSLEALGIGKFNVFTIHLHAIVSGTTQVAAPSNQCVELLESDDDDEGVDGRVKGRNNNAAGSADVDVLDMTTTAATAAVERSNNRNRPTSNHRKHNQQQQQNDNKAVVDLLDSDSDDDVVEIIESSTSGGNKRRKRN